MSRNSTRFIAAISLVFAASAHANTIKFDTPPFDGTTVLSAPGRQIVGGEFFVNFDIATDSFAFSSAAFGMSGPVNFANDLATNLPAGHINVLVLRDIDNDNNPLTPFGAGNAADLIAAHVTTHGAGFFIYFNQSLDIPRLAYSTDLASSSSDVKILARILNLNGQRGRDAMASFTKDNFTFTGQVASVPEPAILWIFVPGLALVGFASRRRRA